MNLDVARLSLPASDETDLQAVQKAFAAAAPSGLAQAWRSALQPEFRPAAARVGVRGESLLIFAELTDDDISSNATAPNQRMWELGDTFEMFLHAPKAESYFEFHVTPNNLTLQLRIPIPRPLDRAPEEMMVALKLFDSRVWIGDGWHLLAAIPFESTGGRPSRFSFSRYDYTRGKPEPILSSTSPHPVLDFHRRQEWGTLCYP